MANTVGEGVAVMRQKNNKTVKVGEKNYRGFAVALTDQSDDDSQFLETSWIYRKDNAANTDTGLNDNAMRTNGLSRWFVPTVEQWKLGLETAFGAHFDEKMTVVEDKQGTTWQDIIYNYFGDNCMRGASLTDLFWTDTSDASNNANAYVIDFRINQKLRFHSVPKTDTELNEKGIGVRAFIAF